MPVHIQNAFAPSRQTRGSTLSFIVRFT